MSLGVEVGLGSRDFVLDGASYTIVAKLLDG